MELWKRCVTTVTFLVTGVFFAMFGSAFVVQNVCSLSHQSFTTQELMDRLPESHVTGELSQYSLDPDLDALSVSFGQGKDQHVYVPVISDRQAVPDDLSNVRLMIRLSPASFRDWKSGSIRIGVRYPQSNTPMLNAYGDSELLAQLPFLLQTDRLWIAEPLEPESLIMIAIVTFGIVFLVVVTFLAVINEWLPLNSDLPRHRLTMGGCALLATGVTLLVLQPRLSPMANLLRPGIGGSLLAAGMALIFRSTVDFLYGYWIRSRPDKIAGDALLAGSPDARIVVLPDRIRLPFHNGGVEVRVDQVESVLLKHNVRAFNDFGEIHSYDSVLTLQFDIGNGLETAVVRHRFDNAETDPLNALNDRLMARIAECWIERLNRGERISSQGWLLDLHTLQPMHGAFRSEIPISSIADVVQDGNSIQIFSEYSERPIVTIDRAQANAEAFEITLRQLVERTRSQSETDSTNATSKNRLGHLILSQRENMDYFIGACVLLIVAMKLAFDRGLALNSPVAITIYVAGGILASLGYLWWRTSGTQIRENGFVVRRWGRDRHFEWSQLAEMSWKQRPVEHEGTIIRNEVLARFVFRDDHGQCHSARFRREFMADKTLEELRDRLSLQLAERLNTECRETGSYQFTRRITLTRDGLEIRSVTAPKTVPYSELEFDFGVRHGRMILRHVTTGKSLANVNMATRNFYPAYIILCWATGRTRDAEPAESELVEV